MTPFEFYVFFSVYAHDAAPRVVSISIVKLAAWYLRVFNKMMVIFQPCFFINSSNVEHIDCVLRWHAYTVMVQKLLQALQMDVCFRIIIIVCV